MLSESAQDYGGNLFLGHLHMIAGKTDVCIHPETSAVMPWGQLMKLGNYGVRCPNTIATPGWALFRLEGCKAWDRIGQGMIFAPRKGNLVGMSGIGHICIYRSRK
jgi:hypothetical protein